MESTPAGSSDAAPQPQRTGTTPSADLLTLQEVCKEFPQFAIWREITPDRTRYFARARNLRLNPHTVITADLAELRDALTGKTPGHPPTPGTAPADTSPPNIARMYSYLTAGKDHVAADRHAADSVLAQFPEVAQIARANRDFVTRAVAHVAAQGINAFVDIGAGLPSALNVHQVAQHVNPAARTCYLDCDELVLVHARALLATGPGVSVAHGDLRDPAGILRLPEVAGILGAGQPVCLLLASVLHFVTPAEADTAVSTLTAALPPGSYLVISAGTANGTDPALVARLRAAYAATSVITARPQDDIAAWFTGFDLLPPGLVDVRDWRAQGASPGHCRAGQGARFVAGIGRKSHLAQGPA